MTDATRRTIRTVVQNVLALAAGLPLIIEAAGIPQTAAGVGVALAVAAAITRRFTSWGTEGCGAAKRSGSPGPKSTSTPPPSRRRSRSLSTGGSPTRAPPRRREARTPSRWNSETAAVLRRRRARQEEQRRARLAAGKVWHDTGKVLTDADGSWLHPEKLSDAFRRILARTDLPPINLRDLRHVAASLAYDASRDIFYVKAVLRHSTIKLTGDTYTSLFTELSQELAERSASLVPRKRTGAEGHASGTHAGQRVGAGGATRPRVPRRALVRAGQSDSEAALFRRPCGTRTHNQWIKSPLNVDSDGTRVVHDEYPYSGLSSPTGPQWRSPSGPTRRNPR
ncbi:hypothetical protein [Streptomyces lasiicapitis]|uniref:Tyr recombinase domain-containing protein n=1 Tax=Streptomyces lasiicapitis TaxID=1923961 RepID=A0ABQ2MLH9_9ACTN|nr:hypothetical protein [Streptomyces lasiicapitis]GGO54067.1 hypothetical protein GCM10012286_62960 [Streptomyces lasiicapitis]